MENKTLNQRTLVWAHRGASAYAPENTLPAFALAAEMQADGIELDVHLSKDGKIVVHHNHDIWDPDIGKAYIRDLTYAEIEKYNMNISREDFIEKYGFVKAPLLDEVYELLAPTGLTVNVEIKSDEEELPAMCIELARKYGMQDKVYYSAFNHLNLMRLHETDISVPTAPLYGQRILFPWVYANLIGASAIHPDWGQVFEIPGIIRECHIRGIRVNPWTVDDEGVMKRCIEAGADALITDLPDVARKLVLEHFAK